MASARIPQDKIDDIIDIIRDIEREIEHTGFVDQYTKHQLYEYLEVLPNYKPIISGLENLIAKYEEQFNYDYRPSSYHDEMEPCKFQTKIRKIFEEIHKMIEANKSAESKVDN